jgi:3-methyl-2-oxobutanoate hydroxymethyltransferase
MKKNPVTVPDIAGRKNSNKKITALTAYDYSFAKLLDATDIDIILVGDSLGMVFLGHENTLSVTMENMIDHTRAVKQGAKRALVVGDMPFMSYQVSVEQAVANAGRHIGLTPQSVHQFGGYKVQGKNYLDSRQIRQDARDLQNAGVFALVMEGLPGALAEEITAELKIPTIGIGAGPKCDGQILVLHDLLGLNQDFVPKFVKQYAQLADSLKDAVSEYIQEVRDETFPGQEHTYSSKQGVLKQVND